MSDINPKNYNGAAVVIVGSAGGSPEIKRFDGGGSVAELSVAVNTGYKNRNGEWVDTGANWYTLSATEDWANNNWPEIFKGDKVRIDGAELSFKPYAKKNGEPGVEASLRFGTVVVVEPKADRPARGGGSEAADGGFNSPF